jgi:DNA-binding NtrC family response regulator
MRPPRILVVDDEMGIRRGLGRVLESKGYAVDVASSCAEAEARAQTQAPDAVVLDHHLPDGDGLELMGRLKKLCPGAPIILLTAHGSIELAVQAIKEGAEQFLTKPVDSPALLLLLERVLEGQRSRRREFAAGRRRSAARLDPFLGTSGALRTLEAECQSILSAEASVLILGETGSGKGVLARWIHESGPRAEEAFVDLNCAGFSKELLESELFGHSAGAFTGATGSKPGLLEIAHHGTAFLDEIGDLDVLIQPKVLKVLEDRRFRRLGEVRDRQVDVRLISATHQDLESLVREKKFRQDLYYRINTIELRVPPLRERAEDIAIIAGHLVARLASELGRGQARLSPDAEKVLLAHSWPGNIRELRNTIERALLVCGGPVIEAAHLRLGPAPAPPPAAPSVESLNLAKAERETIERALQTFRWQISDAAHALGISRTTLYERIRQYELKAPD